MSTPEAAAKARKAPRTKRPKEVGGLISLRHQAFCDEWLANGGNTTQAAVKAGFSPKTAPSQGSRLLKDVKVSEYIARAQAKAEDRTQINLEWVLTQAADLYRECREVEDRRGAAKALELVGKHTNIGAWKEKHEITGPDGGPIEHKWTVEVKTI